MQSIRSFVIREVGRIIMKRANQNRGTITEQRKSMEALIKWVKVSKLVHVEKLNADSVEIEKISYANADKENIIMHLHGGGYTTGSINTYRILEASISKPSKSLVILPEYKLAPEYPFPSAINDALKVYRWILKQGIKSSNIIISGDSAGGGLAVATVMSLRDNGEPLPAGIICISPWVDLCCKGNSHVTKAKVDPALTLSYVRECILHYAGQEDLKNPFLSPIYGDFHNLPPMLIQVGSEEILLDDSIVLAKKARSANVDVNFKIWNGMWHEWHMFGNFIPESRQALEEIGSFTRNIFEEKIATYV